MMEDVMQFRGSIVAIVTPFKNGKLDENALVKLVEWHIAKGTSGIVPCGTTGESATLSHEEHERVISVVIKAANKRIPVIAGTGSNNTVEAIRLTKHAETAGADACLIISPYYNKPTQRGLYEHFKAVAESVKIPIVAYNIASRTGVNIEPETMQRISLIKNITAVKEASGNLEQMSRIKYLCGHDFTLLSGDDALTLPMLAIGATGVISVVANIVPDHVARMVKAFEEGNIEFAQEIHYRLLPLVRAMFIETNPIPLKTAMGLMGLCKPEMRLPLVNMEEKNIEVIKKELKNYKLI
jgi:4-hydroxy-tetrahydrodipicolinate synthase